MRTKFNEMREKKLNKINNEFRMIKNPFSIYVLALPSHFWSHKMQTQFTCAICHFECQGDYFYLEKWRLLQWQTQLTEEYKEKNRTFSQIDVNACKNECFVTYFIVLSVQLQQEKKTKE